MFQGSLVLDYFSWIVLEKPHNFVDIKRGYRIVTGNIYWSGGEKRQERLRYEG